MDYIFRGFSFANIFDMKDFTVISKYSIYS